MSYTVFNKKPVDHLEQPFFFGEELNVARTETVKHRVIDDLTEKQLGFFWRPSELNLSKDIIDFSKLQEHEQHMFIANLKYQTLLDSVQGRAPSIAFLPICSDPALERWIETWSMVEGSIHAASYSHIIRTILPHGMSKVFDEIVTIDEIQERAASVTEAYDNLIQCNCKRMLRTEDYCEDEHRKWLYLTMVAVNVLEAFRFYVSFAVSFSFGERKIMEGNAKTIALIARDEILHLKGTEYILNQWHNNKECPKMYETSIKYRDEAIAIFLEAEQQEKAWAKYLFSLGSVVGLNENVLCKYVEHLVDNRMRRVGLPSPYPITKNPLPWMSNWLNSDNHQVAPQESEKTNYVTGGLDTDTGDMDFGEDL